MQLKNSIHPIKHTYLSFLDNTWLQLPGAAHKSTTFLTPKRVIIKYKCNKTKAKKGNNLKFILVTQSKGIKTIKMIWKKKCNKSFEVVFTQLKTTLSLPLLKNPENSTILKRLLF